MFTCRGGNGQGDKVLSQKLLSLQEELTEFHKRKGEVGVNVFPSLWYNSAAFISIVRDCRRWPQWSDQHVQIA